MSDADALAEATAWSQVYAVCLVNQFTASAAKSAADAALLGWRDTRRRSDVVAPTLLSEQREVVVDSAEFQLPDLTWNHLDFLDQAAGGTGVPPAGSAGVEEESDLDNAGHPFWRWVAQQKATSSHRGDFIRDTRDVLIDGKNPASEIRNGGSRATRRQYAKLLKRYRKECSR